MRITIVGGGVIGLCCAAGLLEAGHQVSVLDDDADCAAASWGNAAHIATEQVVPLASMASLASAFGRRFSAGGPLHMPLAAAGRWLPFAARFLAACAPVRTRCGTAALGALLDDALPAWQQLAQGIGRPDLVRSSGHYVTWETAHQARAGAARWRAAATGGATVHDVPESELATLRALTGARLAGAIRFDGTGQITDLEQLRMALVQAVLARGGTLQPAHAKLAIAGGVARVPGHEGDAVLVAAGVRSRELLEPLGHRVPLIAERGYHIRGAAGTWPEGLPPVVFEDRSMIVTRFAGTVQAASFLEFNDWHAPPDARKWQRLERHVAQLGLRIAPPYTRWVGSRPTLPDYLPAIGRSQRAGNLYYAFGHQHLGLTLAPVTARQVAALVGGAATPLLAPFDLARF